MWFTKILFTNDFVIDLESVKFALENKVEKGIIFKYFSKFRKI